jgi:hypothetical protein
MLKSSQFNVPIQESDAANFTPVTKLPEHLDKYAHLSVKIREKMTPALKVLLELTDKTALRSAAMPQNN